MGNLSKLSLKSTNRAGSWLTAILSGFLCAGNLALGNTYLVTNTADNGAGSLRQAITSANANPGANAVNFQISGTKPFTISLFSSLPAITNQMTIDGTTQSGYVNAPVVELNGASAGSGSIGLQLNSAFITVKALAINRFSSQGMVLNSASNTVQGNYIGTDTTGVNAHGNGDVGIWVKSAGNLIGGTSAGSGNLISGGNSSGIYILSGNNNTVQGNLIGLGADGVTALGNVNYGILINSGSGNVIGGALGGARNVISGNGSSGVYLTGGGAAGNLVQGNYLGTDFSGGVMVSNIGDGITVNGSPANTFNANVISGNREYGIFLTGSGAVSNLVTGNDIGTDATGKLALGNMTNGVTLFSGASHNWVGGTNAGAGNVISGNLQNGVALTGAANQNLIQGNLIGLSAAGTNALANGNNGISISGASSNLVGGTVAAARNVISGNIYNGVGILLATDVFNTVAGNYIGTDITGTKSVANLQSGVRVQGCSNVIGGVVSGSGNVISGNGQEGVWLVVSTASPTGNFVEGNYLGLDATGTTALGNGDAGVGITSAARNQIGGSATAARNVISANGAEGIFLIGTNTTGNILQGNFIGTDQSGLVARGNTFEGIYVQDVATNQIGGSVAGAGNLISGNLGRGIWLTNAPGNMIQGNFIGTKADGSNALGNVFHGIDIDVGSTNNTVGGSAAGAGNRIAYAQTVYAGVRVRTGAMNNLISGNAIFNNGALGIDLGNNGVNNNVDCESGIAANAANAGQNFPVITNVYSGGSTVIRGTLDSAQNKTYLLQFFASPSGDGSGYGEGQLFLGQTNLALGAMCSSNFAVFLPSSLPSGWVVTATATDPANNTSEFSAWVAATFVPVLQLTSRTNRQFSLSWTNSGNYVLEQTTNLNSPTVWTTVAGTPGLTNGLWTLPLSATNSSTFYRLTAP